MTIVGIKKLLIVDDENLFAQGLKELLQKIEQAKGGDIDVIRAGWPALIQAG